jgi:hypothetical protein
MGNIYSTQCVVIGLQTVIAQENMVMANMSEKQSVLVNEHQIQLHYIYDKEDVICPLKYEVISTKLLLLK